MLTNISRIRKITNLAIIQTYKRKGKEGPGSLQISQKSQI